MKLGCLEKKILKVLYQSVGKDEHYYGIPEGNNEKGIAEIIFGEKAFSHLEYLANTKSASVSRALNMLHRKRLVQSAVHFFKRNGAIHAVGRRYKGDLGIHMELRNKNTRITELPYDTRKWWMLTKEGRIMAERLR